MPQCTPGQLTVGKNPCDKGKHRNNQYHGRHSEISKNLEVLGEIDNKAGGVYSMKHQQSEHEGHEHKEIMIGPVKYSR